MNLAFFDLETTGTDTEQDKIVSICVQMLGPDWTAVENPRYHLINPQRPIPPEATAVHGITDEMVKDKPTFPQIAKALHAYIDGCNYGGYNILNFDVPLLAAEFARCRMRWPWKGAKYADALKIFYEMEPRDLAGAKKFYLNDTHEGAHDAAADVSATIEVFAAQLIRYKDQLPDLAAVDKMSRGKSVDLAGKLVWTADGRVVYNIGNDKGKEVRTHPSFANWMLRNNFPQETKDVLQQILSGNFNG